MKKLASRWGYFDSVRFRPNAPAIRTFHYKCFNASIVDNSREPRQNPRPGNVGRPIQLIKNIYNIAPVFVADYSQLIVNRDVLDILMKNAKVDFQRAEFVRAWNYPFRAGSEAYEADDAYPSDPEFDDGEYLSFVEKYQVPVPELEYYEVIMHGYEITHIDFAGKIEKYRDSREVDIIGTLDGRSTVELEISRTLLSEVKLYRAGAFICDPALLELLSPFLDSQFFWKETFPY